MWLPGPARKALGGEKGIGLEQAVERALAQDNNYSFGRSFCSQHLLHTWLQNNIVHTVPQTLSISNACICGPVVCVYVGRRWGGTGSSESLV